MGANNSANGQSETHAIAPSGDTILVVGDRKTELQVHSFCMRTASKVFDAMFGPHFSEGQPSNGNHPKKIPMPDDNAAAMTTICNVIHHRNDLLPDVLQPSELPEIALAADKYDCVLVLKYVMIQWLDFKEPITFFDLGSLLIAAYVFDNSDAFRRVAQKLITGFPCAYHSLMQSKYGETIPLSIYCKFIPFWQIIAVAKCIARLVRKSENPYSSQCPGRAPSRNGTLLRLYEVRGLWSFPSARKRQCVGCFAIQGVNR